MELVLLAIGEAVGPFLAAAALAFVLIALLMPGFRAYAMSRPEARSATTVPTPQGGGIAVILAALVATGWFGLPQAGAMAPLAGAAVVIMAVGLIDDIRPMAVAPRLVLQALAVAMALWVAMGQGRLMAEPVPHGLEFAIALLAGLWFVNLTNFMDGLDWITVSIQLPALFGLVVFGLAGVLPPFDLVLAAALAGGLLGFAPFNRPVARLYLGDAGSLPLGLMMAYLLFRLATEGHLAAALLLQAYPCADASLTVIRRAMQRQNLFTAHRDHAYQRAHRRGERVIGIDAGVAFAGLCLAGLAAVSVFVDGWLYDALCLVLGAVVVTALVRWLSK